MGVLDNLKEERAREEASKASEQAERVEKAIQVLRQAIVSEFGEEILAEFAVIFGLHGSRPAAPYAEFHYNGKARRFDRQGYNISTILTPQSLVDWCEKVDEEIEKYNAERAGKRLEIVIQAQNNSHFLHSQWDRAIQNYRLLEFPEVVEAIALADARAAELEAERERERIAQENQEIEQAVAELDRVADYADLHSFDERYGYSDLRSDERIQAARASAAERAEQHMQDEMQRETFRLHAEALAFFPFAFYRVHYGIIVTDGGDSFVETDCYDSLRPIPDESGWWIFCGHKSPVRLYNVVKVERIRVESVDDLPGWCPARMSEYGKIKAPPEQAERLEV